MKKKILIIAAVILLVVVILVVSLTTADSDESLKEVAVMTVWSFMPRTVPTSGTATIALTTAYSAGHNKTGSTTNPPSDLGHRAATPAINARLPPWDGCRM